MQNRWSLIFCCGVVRPVGVVLAQQAVSLFDTMALEPRLHKIKKRAWNTA